MISPGRVRLSAAVVLCAVLLTWGVGCSRQLPESGAGAQPVPVGQEPHHHLLLDNQFVSVYRAELRPGDVTKFHRHDNDYVAVYLTSAQLSELRPGKPVQSIRHEEGEVRYSQGSLAHTVTNTGRTPFRMVVVELKKAPNGAAGAQATSTEHSLDLGHGHIEEQLLDNERVRVTDAQIAPGMHSDQEAGTHPQLLVWMDSGELSSHDGEQIHGNQGDVSWLKANVGMLHNTGAKQAHVVLVELK